MKVVTTQTLWRRGVMTPLVLITVSVLAVIIAATLHAIAQNNRMHRHATRKSHAVATERSALRWLQQSAAIGDEAIELNFSGDDNKNQQVLVRIKRQQDGWIQVVTTLSTRDKVTARLETIVKEFKRRDDAGTDAAEDAANQDNNENEGLDE